MFRRQPEDGDPEPLPTGPEASAATTGSDRVRGEAQVTLLPMRLLDTEAPAAVAHDRRRPAADIRLGGYLSRSCRDPLTGAMLRDVGRTRLQRDLDRTNAHRGVVAFAYLGVAGLDEINSGDGYAAGDAVLVAVATALADRLRSSDLVVRWRGDVFVSALPTTSMTDARRRLTEVRTRLHELHPVADVATGVAVLRRDETLDSVVDRAEHDVHQGRRP